MKFRFSRKGDTLIEVLLAIGIFSMVAIAVVSVVSGSTSSAQSALELTLTREEIDAQAEAIRFIHSSYMAGGDTNLAGNDRYKELWNKITSLADKNTGIDLTYAPATCNELYDADNENGLVNQHAFIINTHYMGDESNNYVNMIIKEANTNNTLNDIFGVTQTYPRIYYDNELDNEGNFVDNLSSSAVMEQEDIVGVEGLFVVPVKDNSGTLVVDKNSTVNSAAYYDFYIRSCWFGPGADRPSTISTVVRLMDPNAISNQ